MCGPREVVHIVHASRLITSHLPPGGEWSLLPWLLWLTCACTRCGPIRLDSKLPLHAFITMVICEYCAPTMVHVYVLSTHHGPCVCTVYPPWSMCMYCAPTMVHVCTVYPPWSMCMYCVPTMVHVYVLCTHHGPCVCTEHPPWSMCMY